MQESTQVLQYPYINQQSKREIERNLERYLKKLNKENLFNPLTYVVREITANASKANLKRIHFKKHQLDIHSEQDYQKGMASFRLALTESVDLYESMAESEGFYVRTHMGLERDSFVLLVENNARLLPEEQKRIDNKISKAQAENASMDDLYYDEIDPTEGAGLGFISIINIMRNLGISPENFRIISQRDKTQVKIAIPLRVGSQDEYLARSILQEWQILSHYPPHQEKIKKLLEMPYPSMEKLEKIIQQDPLLISEVLKAANNRQPGIINLKEAMKLLGFSGLKEEILIRVSNQKNHTQYDWETIEKVFSHSRDVALIAARIAKKYRQDRILEELEMAALLHDIGKIVISTLSPEKLARLKEIMEEKKLNPYLTSQVGKHHNHALLGAMLAEQWQLPVPLVLAIRYHHLPFRAEGEKYRALLNILYLANLMKKYQEGKVLYADIFSEVLDFFQIKNQQDFEDLTAFAAQPA